MPHRLRRPPEIGAAIFIIFCETHADVAADAMPSPFDPEWASNLIDLRLNIPNCWWPGFSDKEGNLATLVEIDPGEIDMLLFCVSPRARGGRDGRGWDGRPPYLQERILTILFISDNLGEV